MIERVIVSLDVLSALGFAAALLFALRIKTTDVLERGSQAFLAACLGLYVFVGLSNVLEHSGVTAALDRFEDYAEILFLPFFLYFIYSLRTGREFRRRKQAEDALRESEERVRLLLDSADDIIVMQDLEGRYLYCSASPQYGITTEDVVGKMPSEFFDPETAAHIIRRIKHVAETGLSLTEENQIHWQGNAIWFLDHIYPIKNPDGSVFAVGTICRNFSELRSLEDERRSLIEELQAALAKVKMLSGMLPICASCKKIRDDQGYWRKIEEYIREHSEADFSHSICPACAKKLYPDMVHPAEGPAPRKQGR